MLGDFVVRQKDLREIMAYAQRERQLDRTEARGAYPPGEMQKMRHLSLRYLLNNTRQDVRNG